jgi:hypothetical protein
LCHSCIIDVLEVVPHISVSSILCPSPFWYPDNQQQPMGLAPGGLGQQWHSSIRHDFLQKGHASS